MRPFRALYMLLCLCKFVDLVGCIVVAFFIFIWDFLGLLWFGFGDL